jgi:hypothetical protein
MKKIYEKIDKLFCTFTLKPTLPQLALEKGLTLDIPVDAKVILTRGLI